MKMEMTERDKKLIVMLSMFVIIVGIGYWGVFATLKDIWAMDKEIAEQKEKQEVNELKLMQIPILEIDNEDLEEEIVEARKQYYPMMNSAQIDQYITDMILSYDLYSYDLKISIGSEETELDAYQYAGEAGEDEDDFLLGYDADASTMGQLDSMLGMGDSDGDFVAFEEEPETGIYTATLDLRLGGDEAQLNTFLNDLMNTDRKVLVKNYSWGKERNIEFTRAENENELGEYVIVSARTLTVKLEMYMCEE